MINKKGISGFMILGIVATALLALLVGSQFGLFGGLTRQAALDPDNEEAITNPLARPESTATLTLNPRNALSKSTPVTATYSIRVEQPDGTMGSPNPIAAGSNSTVVGMGKKVVI